MPTAQQTIEDAEFLLIVVRPDFYEQAKIIKVSKLLTIAYENTPPCGSSMDAHMPSHAKAEFQAQVISVSVSPCLRAWGWIAMSSIRASLFVYSFVDKNASS